MSALLLRIENRPTRTRGVFFVDRGNGFEPMWVTVEREWNGNQIGESCIPDGIYPVQRFHSKRFGECFRLDDGATIPRTDILIHPANWASQLNGCIALGKEFQIGSPVSENPGVLRSREAMGEALRYLPYNFDLTVKTTKTEGSTLSGSTFAGPTFARPTFAGPTLSDVFG